MPDYENVLTFTSHSVFAIEHMTLVKCFRLRYVFGWVKAGSVIPLFLDAAAATWVLEPVADARILSIGPS